MAALDWITGLLGKGIVEPIATYYTRRQELKAAKFQAELASIQATGERTAQLIREGLAADASWELEQIKNSGWKDEWVLIILSIPLIGCFLPVINGYILAGFLTLETTPSWYRWLIMLIFTAVYGIRIWRRQITDTP